MKLKFKSFNEMKQWMSSSEEGIRYRSSLYKKGGKKGGKKRNK